MTQVEIFTNKTVTGLKERINTFRKSHHVTQISYTTYTHRDQTFFSCMVLYES